MEQDIFFSALSFLFALSIIFVGEILQRTSCLSLENTRKFIHIGVCHWWLLAYFTISSCLFAIIPPILFTILNYLSYRLNLIKSMERNKEKDLGTVYYALSLVLLVFFTWENETYQYYAMMGIFVLGYGDGFAAIVGQKYPWKTFLIWGNAKTMSGSFAMFVVSFIACFILLLFVYPPIEAIKMSIIYAFIATIVEIIAPWKMDNLAIPLSVLSVYFLTKTTWLYVFVAITIAVFISLMAYKKESLTKGGTIGALILGGIIACTSELIGIFALLLFFVSSSLLSRYKKSNKKTIEEKFAKTGKRDIFQVLANGIVGTALSTLYYFTGNEIFLFSMIASFATANADTWATELGVLSNSDPISLRSFKKVVPGTSGAISIWGLFCSFLGAFFVVFPCVFAFEGVLSSRLYSLSIVLVLCGFIGAFIDSVVGATLQVMYENENFEHTEKSFKDNGKKNKKIKGLSIINNDVVNFISILMAVFISFLLLKHC